MRYFSCVSDAFKELSKNNYLEGEDRDILVRYITTESYYALQFLKEGLFINNMELEKAKKRIMRDTDVVVSFLTQLSHLLSEEEKEFYIELISTSSKSSVNALQKLELTPQQRAECFKTAVLTIDYTKTFIKNCGLSISDEEQQYILNLHQYREDIVKSMAEHCPQQTPTRKYLFSYILSQQEFAFELAKKNKITSSEELKLIYEQNGVIYFNAFRSKVWDCLDYCIAFEKFLNEEEIGIYFKRLQNKRCRSVLRNRIDKLTLPQQMMDRLYSILIMDKLSSC